MVWKMYIQMQSNGKDISIPVPGTFKTQEDAEMFYRRNKAAFQQKDGSYGKPVIVDQGKGRGKK